MPFLRLAIPSPLRQLFDYLPPENMEQHSLDALAPGCRLEVPFGSRQVCGLLVEIAAESTLDGKRLKAAAAIVDEQPLISPTLLKLCFWASEYYKYPLGEILAAALPTALRQGKAHRAATVRHWQLSTTGKGLPEGALGRAPQQAKLLALLQQHESIDAEQMTAAGISAAVRRQLETKGLIATLEVPLPRVPAAAGEGPELSAEQQAGVEAVAGELETFGCFLLEGVTGSGKTEIYLRLIQRVLEAGRQALVLVPEIGLTPQTIARFEQRFDAEIAVLHSGMADGARLDAWEAARSGRAHIVIGTRSAIFASLAEPGLIVVDEEHDSSFKQHEGFRYSARDLAVKRAQLEGIPVILGSATPSLESLHNANAGRYRKLQLRQRVGAGKLPGFSILDIRQSPLQGGMSETLLQAVATELKAGNQILLFLNRRGYAPTLQCHDCGYVAECRHCDSRLTLHRRLNELRCHHCEWRQAIPGNCPQCGGAQLSAQGIGTEQSESVLRKLFPGTALYRVDRDSMQRRGAMSEVLAAVHQGDPCILLGTQMLTKGHHFPDVTLVGLIDTDAGLFSADFRGPERMGQLLTQVAGRAGRADKPGHVILQTHYPDHPLVRILLEQGYDGFAAELLEQRRQAGLPPFGQLLMLRAEARQMAMAEEFLRDVRAGAEKNSSGEVQFIGPLPAPMQRKSGRYRAQLLLSSPSRSAVQRAAQTLVDVAEDLPAGKRLRWSLDVDPLDTF
jgi:primosomal protein N' (replication factor Y)